MKKNSSALFSEYIIDGVRMDRTPARMLAECGQEESAECGPEDLAGSPELPGTEAVEPIVDETRDPSPGVSKYSQSQISNYMRSALDFTKNQRDFELLFPTFFTRMKVAQAVIDSLWMDGHFKLEDLRLAADWSWDPAPVGNMAAFWSSAEAASEYIFDIGVTLAKYSYTEKEGGCRADFRVCGVSDGLPRTETCASDCEDAEDEGRPGDGISEDLWLSKALKCPGEAADDPKSWLIYIPFDTCPYRLGGSVLEKIAGQGTDTAPELRDPDYFIDCYEVVRELVEDGVAISGVTVSDGGLMTAAGRLCGKCGTCLDISGIMSSCMEDDMVRILFSEVPGVLLQIRDSDYDYMDAQLILQDIAYYPLGHPGGGEVSATCGSRSGVAGILASLIYGQGASEGED